MRLGERLTPESAQSASTRVAWSFMEPSGRHRCSQGNSTVTPQFGSLEAA